MIDRQTIERILDAAQIVDVIQEFVPLKKRGVNYLGLCPFHNEKTPSNFVTMAWGCRYRCMEYMDMGVPYEYPLSGNHNGLMDNRITFDLVFHF